MSDCTALSFVADGIVQYSTVPSASGNFIYGTVATYSCADDYELVGEVSRTCLMDGTWTGAEPYCRTRGYYIIFQAIFITIHLC